MKQLVGAFPNFTKAFKKHLLPELQSALKPHVIDILTLISATSENDFNLTGRKELVFNLLSYIGECSKYYERIYM